MTSKRISVGSSSYSSSCSDSAFGEHDASSSPSPSPESIRATLDMYVSSAKIGREAYVKGDLRSAVHQFDHALALELQTEMDCIYDPSIGMVSGLVRQEVSQRFQKGVSPTNSCARVMKTLLQDYTACIEKVKNKPTDPKLYLRMGAALCCVDEWEKAEKIYSDGLQACKDRKGLKLALKKLQRMKQITTGKDIPTEPYEPNCLDISTSKRPKSSLNPLRLSRPKSASVELDTLDFTDTSSVSPKRLSPARIIGLHKPRRRVSSFGRKQKSNSGESLGERESWSTVFLSDFASDQVYMRPSAITQMRRLSVDILDASDDQSPPPLQGTLSRHSFAVVNNFRSMKIDSDDSELESD